jgi:mRNA-degrading endonuclease RelE of RelBE toxin-antitoxin system
MNRESSENQQSLQESQSIVSIDSAPELQQNIRDLIKKGYRSIRTDIETVTPELKMGNFVGDRITGVGETYMVYKVRIKNSDVKKGKSGGYRLIYQVESKTSVLLLAIYSKLDRSNIPAREILGILSEFYQND